MDACKESFLNYLLIHGKDGPSPVIRSFFKVMINKRFSDVLFLPPKFAKELSFAGNEVQVEDIKGSGRQWIMELCFVKGYLSFGKGWHDFATDHGIEYGDIVIVHHILDARFVVQVYGKSGCEKLPDPSTSHNTKNKRSGTSMDKDSGISIDSDVNMDISQDNDDGFPEAQLSDSTDGPISEDPYVKQSNNQECSKADLGDSTNGKGVKRPFFEDPYVNQGNNEDSSKADLSDSTKGKGVKRPFVEDPCCIIIDRDLDSTSKDDVRRCFFDLSEFETCSTAKPVGENCSVPVQDGGFSNPVEENIFSSFEENIIDYADFDAAMRIPCDDGNNDICSKDGEISGKVLPESCPSMSALSATDYKKHACVSAQPSQEAQTVTVEDEAVVKECEDFNLKCSVGERAQSGGSVRRTNDQHNKFNSEKFGRSVGIVRKEGKGFNPQGSGASVRIAKKEPNDYNPGAFGPSGGSVRIGKNECKEFNPGGSVKRVKKDPNGFNPKSFGGDARTIKKELNEIPSPCFGMNHNANEHLQENQASGSRPALKRAKAEAVDFAEPLPPLQVKCLVKSDSDLFIELPMNFSSLGHRGSMGAEEKVYQKKIVYLQGSGSRLWPTLYQKHMGLRVLTAGWKSFKEANGIQAGDECVFALENDSEGIYGVNVVRK